MMGDTQLGKDLPQSSMQGWGRFQASLRGSPSLWRARRPHSKLGSRGLLPFASTPERLLLALGPQGK